MKNMMSQVKNYNRLFIAALVVSALALFGCKDKETPVDPFVTPGTTENPNWVVTVDNNLSASMTVVAKVSFADQPGSLAAFIGNECCGVAKYNAEFGLYWLYISPADEAGGDVQLKFYSPELKRIFHATTTFPFGNDTNLGSVSTPYTPSWVASN